MNDDDDDNDDEDDDEDDNNNGITRSRQDNEGDANMSHDLPGNNYHCGGNILPRWKYYHRGGNISPAVEILFHLIHNFSLDSLQRNLDFIVFT